MRSFLASVMPDVLSPEDYAAEMASRQGFTQIAGNNELENLRRILAKDKGGAKPITPPMSDQQILENLRRLLQENG